MGSARVIVGLVQIGEVVWERRPSRHFHLVEGALRPKPTAAVLNAASLAYLPQSVALLQAYAEQYASGRLEFSFLPILYKAKSVVDSADHLVEANVVGFSTYVWNARFSLALAAELKRRRPDILIVMGGPQVPDEAEVFLRDNPFVDIICHGEGERTFLEILERADTRTWSGVESTSYLDEAGRFIANPRRTRLKNLDEIPSPMLSGLYERIMRQAPEQQWLATWETNRGCPFACSFCDWGSATASKVGAYSWARIAAEIEWLAKNGIHHLFVCDANFGILPRDVEIAEEISAAYTRNRSHVAISVQNAKNRADRSERIQRVFQKSRAISFGASISLQSVNPFVLKAIKRDNISLEAFDQLHKHYAREGLETYSDLIIGLPGESLSSFVGGVCQVIGRGQLNRIAFYECSILPNATMAQPDYRAQFALETVPVRIIHAHEPLEHVRDRIPEYLDIVVSTSTMTREDWVQARIFADFVELLFFNRLLHVPLVLMGSGLGIEYERLFYAFMNADPIEFPVVTSLYQTFDAHARTMMDGAPQYLRSEEWLGLWWPADQYALIGLAQNGELGTFYREAESILVRCAQTHSIDGTLICDAVRLNHAMFAVPFMLSDEDVDARYPVYEAYQGILGGLAPRFESRPSAYRVQRTETIWMSWKDWMEDLVRRAYVRRGYLYSVQVQRLGLTGDDDCMRAAQPVGSVTLPGLGAIRA